MIFPHPNKAIRRFYPDALWRVKTDKKELFLTFDDGPEPRITEKVLEILGEFNAKATFFCMGSKIEENPKLLEDILKSGHTVGNHSFSHLKGRKTKNINYFADIEKAARMINSKFLRPPFGSIKMSQYKYLKKKYQLVFWDIISYDFHPKVDGDRCFGIIKKYTQPGSIIVFHDNEKAVDTMLPSLEQTLKYFKNQGYQFKSLMAHG